MKYDELMRSPGLNRAQIARRVIEALEFFDKDHPRATVTDMVRRYNWPQSSTSELLMTLVGLGLLHKDPRTRYYWPTPRAAMLGSDTQPGVVRDGALIGLMDCLSEQTGFGVGIFGLVGLNVQVYGWCPGKHALPATKAMGIRSGEREYLSDSAAGWLLLSTVAQPDRNNMIRHMKAEAEPGREFSFADVSARAQRCREQGCVTGLAGFGSIADMSAVLLPGLPENRPLVIGFVYGRSDQIDPETLLQKLRHGVSRLVPDKGLEGASVQRLFNIA